MKKLLIILAILIVCQSCKKEAAPKKTNKQQLSGKEEVLANGQWSRLADYPGYIFHHSGFSIKDQGYIGLGYFRTPLSGFMKYDPVSNTWSQIADFGGGKRTDAVGFAINGKGYIYGGANELGEDHTPTDFWEYDPDVNKWTRKADLPAKGRLSPLGFSIGSYGYAGGGRLRDTILVNGCPAINLYISNDVYRYDPVSNVWCKKAAFPGEPRIASVEFSIGDKAYLGTGGNLLDELKNDFWEYDSKTDKWTRKADFPGNPRTFASGFSICSLKKGYIGFGRGSGNVFNFFEYDPETDNWTEKATPNMTGEFQQAIGFSIGKKGYVGPGGLGEETQFWQFDPLL